MIIIKFQNLQQFEFFFSHLITEKISLRFKGAHQLPRLDGITIAYFQIMLCSLAQPFALPTSVKSGKV